MLKAAHAIYKEGRLIFANEQIVPQDGTEVIVTFFEEAKESVKASTDAIKALRGRGKGEKLVEKLLHLRQEDLEHDEENYRRLRS
ncbi:hypothetical protein H8E77_21930 [bacterium]|nr:hypothetical protein [bacterium]